MNKTKRVFQIISGIISLIASVWLAIFFGFTSYYLYIDLQLEIQLMIILLFASFIISIASIVISSLICVKPKPNSTHKGLCITVIILHTLLAGVLITIKNFYAIISIICLIMLIISLSIKNKIKEEVAKEIYEVNETQETLNNLFESDEQVALKKSELINESETESLSLEDRVQKIRKLNADGIISDEEMKTLIDEEFDK